MTFSELKTFVGYLVNDPDNARYSATVVSQVLDQVQERWNLDAKIIKDSVTITVVDGTRTYALSGLTGTPISFYRVAHKGIELRKVSKTWLDLYTGHDWTADNGTPTRFFIDVEDPDSQNIVLYMTPGAGDAGANLVVEYGKRHTAMSSDSDVPFLSGTSSNTELRPYDQYLGYDAAHKLLLRDPSQENLVKAIGSDGRSGYLGIATDGLDQLIQNFKALEKQEPPRLRGGRRSGANSYVHL